jgi:hypothetical protein
MSASEQLAASRARLKRAIAPDGNQPAVGGVTEALLSAYLRPVATRRPLSLVLSAAGVGALVAWSRPWRWVDREALVRIAIPYVVAHLLRGQESPPDTPDTPTD